jgi:hypothetical protein
MSMKTAARTICFVATLATCSGLAVQKPADSEKIPTKIAGTYGGVSSLRYECGIALRSSSSPRALLKFLVGN